MAIVEGFDDGGEAGSGQKLLYLLQKLDIENIVLIVCIWDNGLKLGASTLKGGELFKVVLEKAKELLSVIHD